MIYEELKGRLLSRGRQPQQEPLKSNKEGRLHLSQLSTFGLGLINLRWNLINYNNNFKLEWMGEEKDRKKRIKIKKESNRWCD